MSGLYSCSKVCFQAGKLQGIIHTMFVGVRDCCCCRRHQVLCASNEAHDQVDPITPPEGVPVGERITFEG